MLFKCRLCGNFADDGDIKCCICLACIEDNPSFYVFQRHLIFAEDKEKEEKEKQDV